MFFDREWNFGDSAPSALDTIHPYPAKFIREIPEKLISEIHPDKTLFVYDPFCGSGTTLSVAQEMGYKTLGVDINPIACLISRVKVSPSKNYSDFKIKKFLNTARASANYNEYINIKNLNHWFQPHVINEISSIKRSISKIKDKYLLDILNLVLSSIIVRISNQDSNTRYAAISKNIPEMITYDLFEKSFGKIISALDKRNYQLAESFIFSDDTLKFDDSMFKNRIGMVITSPPYPNAYEYWLYHKYRMYWLGYDPIEVKEAEIGARAHFFKKNHHDEHSFYNQMLILFEKLKSYLIKDGYACFVVGRSKIHGKIVDNANILSKAAQKNSFKIIDMIERELNSARKSFNLSHANIKKETIVILQNGY